jgi:hypothetical protein
MKAKVISSGWGQGRRALLAALGLAIASGAGAPGVAHAEAATDLAFERAPKTISITIEPLLFIYPMAEVTGEYRLSDQVGVAGIVGVGSFRFDDDSRGSLFSLGAQGRYYAVGDFQHGLQLGAEGKYLSASATDGDLAIAGGGVSVGAFAGYKYTANFGLTVDAQLGVQAYGVAASSDEFSDSDSGVGPLFNLNIGWSF